MQSTKIADETNCKLILDKREIAMIRSCMGNVLATLHKPGNDPMIGGSPSSKVTKLSDELYEFMHRENIPLF